MFIDNESAVNAKISTPEEQKLRRGIGTQRKHKSALKGLLKLAEQYNVTDNQIFKSACEQYAFQLAVIDRIKESLDRDELLVTKEYVKDRENVYVNPLIKELPKHLDSANRTVATILSVISHLGTETPSRSTLAKTLDSLMES